MTRSPSSPGRSPSSQESRLGTTTWPKPSCTRHVPRRSFGERTGQRFEPVPTRSKVDASQRTSASSIRPLAGPWSWPRRRSNGTQRQQASLRTGGVLRVKGQLQLPGPQGLADSLRDATSAAGAQPRERTGPWFHRRTARAGLARLHRGQPAGLLAFRRCPGRVPRQQGRGHPAAGAGRRKGPGQPHRRPDPAVRRCAAGNAARSAPWCCWRA